MLSPRDLASLFTEGTVEKVLAKAQKLAAKGRADQATQVLKEGIARLGESPDLRLEMATLALGGGRPKEAADSLRALLKADSSQLSRVEEFVGWARSQHSDIQPLYEPLAEGHVARRNYAAAFDCLERIDRKALEGLIEARLSNLNRFLEKGAAVPRSAVPTLFTAALGWEAVGDWQKAMDCYRKVLAASPNDLAAVDERLRNLVGRHYKNTALRLHYAGMLTGLGQHDRALQEHLTALEVDPRTAPQVSQYLTSRLAESPEDGQLLWSSVQVDLAAGRVSEALEMCGRLADAGQRLPEIEKLLEDLSAGGKETVDTQLLLARVATAQGKAARAIAAVVAALSQDAGERGMAALERLVEAFPSEPRPYQILADFHLREGRVSACLETYRRLRRVDPSTAPGIAARLQAVLVADPGNMEARQLLEEVCVESGDARGAVPFLRRRIRQNPERASEVLEQLRPMRVAHPEEKSLSLAAAEASLAAGDAEAAWNFLQDLIAPSAPPDPAVLHLMVMAGGASADLWRALSAFMASRAAAWMAHPEVVFALAEAAGRAGLLAESVNGVRAAAKAAPETATVCRESIRSLVAHGQSAAPAERAALAEALAEQDDLSAAIDTLRGIRELPPQSASRLVGRLNDALRRDPKNLHLLACMAQVCLASGQVARALDLARTGLTGREDAATAPLAMVYGDTLCRQGKLAEAAKAYAVAVTRDGGLHSEGIDRLRSVLQLDPGLEPARLALGRLLLHDGQIEDGVRELMEAWGARPDLAATVLKDLDRAARRHAGAIPVDLARARLMAATGQPEAAAELLGGPSLEDRDRASEVQALLEEIVSRHPEAARAQLELGRACARQGWVARACEALGRAHELDRSLDGSVRLVLTALETAFPQDPSPRLGRGVMEQDAQQWLPAAEAFAEAAAMGGPRAPEAIAALASIADTQGVPARVHLLHARACRLAGDAGGCVAAARQSLTSDAAIVPAVREELDRLLEAWPDHGSALLARAECALRLRDTEAAARDLNEALTVDPTIAPETLDAARNLASRQPGSSLAVLALARALELAGEIAEAAEALDGALAGEGARELPLLLARRRLALVCGDAGRARSLLEQAERAAPSRDRLLVLLHQEALSRRDHEKADAGPVEAAIRAGDYARAASLMADEAPSARKAWVLERCGRLAEAAACLERLDTAQAAERDAILHDRVLSRALMGREPALMAEAPLPLQEQRTSVPLKRAAQARQAAQGGAS